MISQEEALLRILSQVRPLPPRKVSLTSAVDCFLARDLFASYALPRFDNSSMDGYAVVASSCVPGARLKVTGEQPAGIDRALTMRSGETIRIFTGAPLPSGADAVIMQEDVNLAGDEIVLLEKVNAGENVRLCGQDVATGQRLLSAGDRIRLQQIPLLAAQGLASVEVGGEVRAAIISTGDELTLAGDSLRPGQIYESNTALLKVLLVKSGIAVSVTAHCADRASEIEEAIRAALSCDVLIITGGVSVGARDLVKAALIATGAMLDLWRVNVKPGKPFLFGHAGQCAIFGLPGNPVSAFVTFLLFVRPALLKLMGASDALLPLPIASAETVEPIENRGERPHYIRGVLREGTFTPVGPQESHALLGLSRSNALFLAGAGERIPAGGRVTVAVWE